MIPANISRKDIEKAIKEIDQNGVPKGHNSTRYDMVYEGKRYPPKHVIFLANDFANPGRPINKRDYNGGRESNSYLEKRGYCIQNK